MKVKSVFIFLISFTSAYKTYSQTITLRLVNSSNDPVLFVNCFDSVKGNQESSNSLGEIILESDKYDLVFTHVSYKQTTLHLNKILRDTTIKISLEIRNVLGIEVMVTTEKKPKSKKIYQAGHFHKNSRNTLVYQTKANVGILIDDYKKEASYNLESINFKLNNAGENRKQNFIIEIKLYEVREGLINTEPINSKPIYVYSSEFKQKNIIPIKQKIKLPHEALFILFSIPLLDKTTNSTVTFPMLVNAKKCELFDVKNKELTTIQTPLSNLKCKYDSFFQAYKAIPIGISYH